MVSRRTYNVTEETKEKLRHSHKKQAKPVRCITDNLIFDSVAEAGRYYNYDSSTLAYNIKNNKLTKGLKFEFIPKEVNTQ